mmetsp:Transcript_9567/g.22705  ORF Transcript_9567/g.22705 Transcript_9567/m.22705 type:complete len:312 (+) Transcript_9567:905-1840(+)
MGLVGDMTIAGSARASLPVTVLPLDGAEPCPGASTIGSLDGLLTPFPAWSLSLSSNMNGFKVSNICSTTIDGALPTASSSIGKALGETSNLPLSASCFTMWSLTSWATWTTASRGMSQRSRSKVLRRWLMWSGSELGSRFRIRLFPSCSRPKRLRFMRARGLRKVRWSCRRMLLQSPSRRLTRRMTSSVHRSKFSRMACRPSRFSTKEASSCFREVSEASKVLATFKKRLRTSSEPSKPASMSPSSWEILRADSMPICPPKRSLASHIFHFSSASLACSCFLRSTHRITTCTTVLSMITARAARRTAAMAK